MSTFHPSAAGDDASEYSSVDGSSNGVPQANEMETTQKDQVKEVQEMAKRETKNMRVWKFVVSLTVLVTAILVSAGTYIFLEGDEDSNFEESFKSFAKTIGDAEEVHSQNLFSTIRSFSNSISAAAVATNSEFPFVTVPTFEVLAESARRQSGTELLIFTPKVEVGEVTRWNEYATNNEGWYEESKQLAVSSSESSSVLSDFEPGNISSIIYDPSSDEEGENLIPANPPFYPIWQFSPPPFSPFALKANFAQLLDFGGYLKTVNTVREGVFGQTSTGPNNLERTSLNQADHAAYHAQFVPLDVEESSAFERPHAFFFQPVFRATFNDTSEIVGTVNALIPWDRYFVNLLPEGVKGITCVLKNTCGQSFTYYLDGKNVSCAPFKTYVLSNVLVVVTN